MRKSARSIILCGIKHCGKSTQGKRLAAALGLDFYDTDDLIYEQSGMDARAIYKSQGKDAFMAAELKACEYLRDKLSGGKAQNAGAASLDAKCAVIATGGGICQNEPAIALLKKLGTIVYLEVPEITAAGRIVREARFLPDGTIQNLPAYIANKNPADQKEVRAIFHDFYLERTKKYRSLADITVQAQGSRSENTKKILSALGAGALKHCNFKLFAKY
ncbi:MAG: hypothetical protein J6V90_07070 [Treponema sp.]|nr:hypothetical protein [Treponema sp.]